MGKIIALFGSSNDETRTVSLKDSSDVIIEIQVPSKLIEEAQTVANIEALNKEGNGPKFWKALDRRVGELIAERGRRK